MSEHVRQHPASRAELKMRILELSMQAFATHGIKNVTMAGIAASLGISKRTLYEIYPDKETLLEHCIRKNIEERDEFLKNVLATANNVLEVILALFRESIKKIHNTNKLFFEDIKKYPKVYEELVQSRHNDSQAEVNFFMQGVRQGIFRDDVNFAIVNQLVHEQFNMLLNSDIFSRYSFLDVYESIMFTYLRGISTKSGAEELEGFLKEYRKKQRIDSQKQTKI